MKNNKTIRFTFRMTEEEAIRFDTEMELQGYHSRSRYIRSCLFGKRVQRRNLSNIESNTLRQVMTLRSDINRIGVNYNQAVKALNTFSNLRDSHGLALITSDMIEGTLTDMRNSMLEILKRIKIINEELKTPDSSNENQEGTIC